MDDCCIFNYFQLISVDKNSDLLLAEEWSAESILSLAGVIEGIINNNSVLFQSPDVRTSQMFMLNYLN